eukprot:scaffold159052_cov28-Prasinocladus_malaysianus.AAC.1
MLWSKITRTLAPPIGHDTCDVSVFRVMLHNLIRLAQYATFEPASFDICENRAKLEGLSMETEMLCKSDVIVRDGDRLRQ